jgi:hypothetical protein
MTTDGVPRRVLLGYANVNEGDSPGARASLARTLTRFAEDGGYALGELFVQTDALAPGAAFLAVADASRRREDVAAVVVPDWTHLGDTSERREQLRAQLRRVTDVPVLAACDGYPTPAATTTGTGSVIGWASDHTRSKASR